MSVPETSNTSPFEDALQSNQAIEVPIGDVKFVSFTAGEPIRSIGTKDLNGGAALVLVSTKGAILANVPLPPYNPLEPQTGLAQVWRKMTAFLNLYKDKVGFFPDADEKRTAVVRRLSSTYQPFREYETNIMSALTSTLGLAMKPRVVSYVVDEGGQIQHTRGCIFIDGRDSIPKVYVEGADQHWFD
ncbi:hypothetical protein AbraIFM66950_001251 [Aspergillus brasiliensis]|nr:hypothetical protein AbraIFM66950_001251 [Aspergillus brasiliensis]